MGGSGSKVIRPGQMEHHIYIRVKSQTNICMADMNLGQRQSPLLQRTYSDQYKKEHLVQQNLVQGSEVGLKGAFVLEVDG